MPASPRADTPAVTLTRGLTVRIIVGGSALMLDGHVWQVNESHLALSAPDLPSDAGTLLGSQVMLVARLRGRLYAFETTLAHVELSPPALIVPLPSVAKRTERRNFYRLNCSIPARAAWFDSRERRHELPDARLLDISGGGALMRARAAVSPGDELRLEFRLPGAEGETQVEARALRCQPEERTHAFRINTQFERIPHHTQEQIIRFIFRQQSLLSRRRSI